MKTTGKIISFAALAAIAIGILMFMKKEKIELSSDGYIGRSGIVIEDGKMGPEALLAFGRLSDPQVSPDGRHILYGVSYTSVEENRSVRNLFVCNLDGSDNQQITTSGKSISNARWSNDGKKIVFLMGGQIWTADIRNKGGRWEIYDPMQISDVANGIGEFKLSPDQKKVMYISYVKSAVKSPSDCYSDLDKATAYTLCCNHHLRLPDSHQNHCAIFHYLLSFLKFYFVKLLPSRASCYLYFYVFSLFIQD